MQTNLIQTVIENKFSYLSQAALKNLQDAVERTNKLEGILVEAGCAMGGSSMVIAQAKSAAKNFYIYDVFGMIPPPSDKDGKDVHERYKIISEGKSRGIRGREYYGYITNLLDVVKSNFDGCGVNRDAHVHFVQGLYQDTMNITSDVSFAHIDCDWYESVTLCLHQIIPHLVSGGEVIVDDYHTWSGCRKAVDEYFIEERKSEFQLYFDERLHIVKL